jgi:hypothetical protein
LTRLLLLSVMVLCATTTCAWGADSPPPRSVDWTAHHGIIEIQFNETALNEVGVRVVATPPQRVAVLHGRKSFLAALEGQIQFSVSAQHLLSVDGGSVVPAMTLELTRGSQRVSLGRTTVRPLPRGGRPLRFGVFDADGTEWFTLDHVHGTLDWATNRFLAENMDVRAGRGLASWSSDSKLEGRVLGVAHVRMLFNPPRNSLQQFSECDPPRWPTRLGRTVDVRITDLPSIQVDCSPVDDCNGQGGSNGSAVVKLTPAVELKNTGTADIPWFAKFLTSPFDHPYRGNDQHPYFVWNAYRIDATGDLVPIGRSGAKHAVIALNSGCSCGNNHVLGIGCSDLYGKSNNDNNVDLGPRSEIIPSTGQWGRCGSFRDRNCDGVNDHVVAHDFQDRLVISERDLDIGTHPGSKFFLEAWYVVRDDKNPVDAIAWTEFKPAWTGKYWSVGSSVRVSQGPFVTAWTEMLGTARGRKTSLESLSTRTGHALVATRVETLGDMKFRYTYVVMNVSFSRYVTEGKEPNLRITSNRGFGGLTIPVRNGDVPIVDASMVDGDNDPLNDWSFDTTDRAVEWHSALSNDLSWGSTFTFSFVASTAPRYGRITLTMPANDATPHTVRALVP